MVPTYLVVVVETRSVLVRGAKGKAGNAFKTHFVVS